MNNYYKINKEGKVIELLTEDQVKERLNIFIHNTSGLLHTGIIAAEDCNLDSFLNDVKELQDMIDEANLSIADNEYCIIMTIQIWNKMIRFARTKKEYIDRLDAMFRFMC